MGGRPRHGVRRLWLAVAVLAPLVAVDGRSSPASAIPVIEYLGEEYVVTMARFPSRLCIGEQKTVTAIVKQYGVYRRGNQRLRARRPRPYRVNRGAGNLGLARLTAESDNPAVLEITDETSILDTVLWYRVGVKAKQVGSAYVSVTAESPGVVGSGGNVAVRVTECDYEVHVFSLWHVNAGRNVVASSSIDTVITGQGHPTGSIYNDQAKAKNLAVSFSPPCVAIYKLPTTDAGVFAHLHDDKLDVEVDHAPNAVETGVTCGRLSGEANDPATLDPIEFHLRASGGSDSAAQVLHAPGIGDFTGTTYITVRPIPR
jgi:hypothetical protein